MSPGHSTGLHIRLFPPLACLETLVCPNLWGHPRCRAWSQQQGNHLDKGSVWGFAGADSGQPKPLCQPTAHLLHTDVLQLLCHQRTPSPHAAVKSWTAFFNSEFFFCLLPNPWDYITGSLFSCLNALFFQSICALSCTNC